MLQQGLCFTLEVDGIEKSATAVVNFTLCQNLSTPFLLNVYIPPQDAVPPQIQRLLSR